MQALVSKAFVVCGLVILTGPLCFMASAQGYVDLEAERAAANAAGRSSDTGANSNNTADPYGARPAQAYPATSYGVSNAPTAPSGVAPATAAPAAAAPPPVAGSQSGASDAGSLFLQIQQMQQEIMRLNGMVEEQQYELNTLKEQSLQRYMDLDKRLGGSGAQPPSTPTTGGPASQTARPAGERSDAIDASAPVAAPIAGVGGRTSTAAAQPGEASAYNAAYALVQGRKFDQAIPAFQQFLKRYPDGEYAANAHYWLGELYLVKEPPDLEASRQSFALLLSQYPDNSKAADALYKLGKVQFLKGNREKAREYLDLVIKQYEGTNNAVVKLAKDFIAQNY
ncbi:MAG TPA: tol-pal system protein YbgF [Halioglobus sp.]